MSIFNINFNSKVIEVLPPDKRQGVMVRWLQSLIAPIQYLNQKILIDYKTGSDYSEWSSITGYAAGAKVTFKGAIFECILANTGNDPSIQAYWQPYLPSFIGSDTRVTFNGQKIILENALNLRFKKTFRQPPLVSDIYVTLIAPITVGFLVGETEMGTTGYVEATEAGGAIRIGYNRTFGQINNFAINIPAAMGTTYNDEINNFVKQIIPAGMSAIIQTY